MAKIALSASRIKTLKSCSWLYYCNYILKLPDAGNLGTQLGWIAHLLFECLGNPRRKKYYDKCLKKKNIYKIDSITRLVKKHFRRFGITNREEAIKLNAWVLCGLAYDFYGKQIGRPTESHSELAFDMTVKEGDADYRIKGFIDKLFLYKKQCLALVRDYKTSKKSFEGSDLTDNLQDQIYALAVSRLYPDFLKIKVEFPFLQLMVKNGLESLVSMPEHSKEDLEDVEALLTEIQKVVDSFSEKDAKSGLAYYKGIPSDGSFGGRLMCGRNNHEGQLKKDGTVMWGCPAKWGYEYYAVRDKKEKKVLRTFFLDQYDKIDYDDSVEYITLEKYKGCPAWNR